MFAGILFVGLALMVGGLLLFIVRSLPSRWHGSRTAAGWMIVVGFCLCLADFLLLLWVVSHVVS